MTTAQTTTTALTKPAGLDPTRLHSPEEYQKWKSDTAAYFQGIRDAERAEQVKEQAVKAYENRILSSTEYFEMAVKREAENKAKQAEREAEQKAAALAEIDRLMASPETVEVLHRSEFTFMLEVIQWANRGYVLNSLMSLMPGLCHAVMSAPAPAPKKAGK
ncbi:MAG: hypothetical protein Q7K57_37455 [Burkholderiaceae bacterium]|nr:hypothetical protein [Burkholderiaceae bacterium]